MGRDHLSNKPIRLLQPSRAESKDLLSAQVRGRAKEGRPPARAHLPLSPTPAGAGCLGRARRPISRAPPPAPPRAPAPGLRRLRVGARHKGGGGGGSGGALEASPPALSRPTSLTQSTGLAAHPQA